MKKLLSLLLFCSLMIMGGTQNVVHAEDDTESTKIAIPEDQIIKNDESGIPDPYLYGLVLLHGDYNKDGILTKDEALNITYMSIFAGAPSKLSLKGIKCLKNLEEIETGWGSGGNTVILPTCTVTNFEEIRELKKLRYLQIFQVKNVDLKLISELKSLNRLELLFCEVKNKNDISELSNMSLNHLQIYQLEGGLNAYHLDCISDCTGLETLELPYNNISSIKPLSKLTSLKTLSLYNNRITDITPIISLRKLETLRIFDNQLKTLPDLKSLSHLQSLEIGRNYLAKEDITSKVADKFIQDENFMKNAIIQNDISYPEDSDNEIIDGLEKPYNNSLENIPSDFIDKIYDSDKGIVVSFTKSVTISPEIFEAASREKKIISFEMFDESGELNYSWTFDGKSDYFIPTNTELNLEMSFNDEKKAEIEKITNFKDGLYMSFAHHGELPIKATMKVKVDNKYKDGDTVFLYYFNEEKNTVESISPLVVKDRYVEFYIEHCSTYFLSKEKIDENKNEAGDKLNNLDKNETTKNDNKVIDDTTKANSPQTGDTTQMTSIFVGLAFTTIGICILRKKRII